jgi:hypothetical protein
LSHAVSARLNSSTSTDANAISVVKSKVESASTRGHH